MKIGILGGTFNPPHLGHRFLLEQFTGQINFDKIFVIPTFIPPHKNSGELADSEQRIEMCRLAFSDIKNTEISTIEIDRKGKSYTFDTLTQLKKQYPNSKLFFLMGSDMFKTFKQWYRYEDILSMCKICTCERHKDEDSKNFFPEYEGKFIYSDAPAFEVSSSEIRSKIKNGGDVSSLLNSRVYDFIVKEGLYSK